MSQYINRELSYLAFNRRIVEIAAAADTPIQEKLRFLTILASNLDEFFMVRVSSLRKMLKKGEECCDSPDHMSNRDLLAKIRHEVEALTVQARQIVTTEIFPPLAKEKVGIKSYSKLSAEQKRYLRAYFCDNILPVLTPLAFDSSTSVPVSEQSIRLPARHLWQGWQRLRLWQISLWFRRNSQQHRAGGCHCP